MLRERSGAVGGPGVRRHARVCARRSSFREASTLRCRFGSSGPAMAARRVGSGQLECAAPPSSLAGARRVEVSLNAQSSSLDEWRRDSRSRRCGEARRGGGSIMACMQFSFFTTVSFENAVSLEQAPSACTDRSE